MIMIVKTPGSQMGSPVAAEEGGEEVGGGRWESGERSEVQSRSTLTSTAPKTRPRSGEVVTLDEVPRISLRVSSKLPSSPSSLLSSVISSCSALPIPAPNLGEGSPYLFSILVREFYLHGSKPLTRSKISEISQRQKCF